jgi:hypothetical protein
MEDGMNEHRTLDRREFTVAAALAALSGVAITITACGGGSGSPTAPSTPPPSSGGGTGTADKTGAISSNHGHRAVISGATLTSPSAISLDIRGDADHPHTVVLTAAEVTSIAANQRLSRESSTDSSHSHTVTFN